MGDIEQGLGPVRPPLTPLLVEAVIEVPAEDQVAVDAFTSLAVGNGKAGYGAVDSSSSGDAKSPEEKGKKDKKKSKVVADIMKIDMASERTFFKWLRTGMQIGAIGTFVFIALDKKQGDMWGIIVVGFAWLVGFLLVLYGLWVFYARQRAVRESNLKAMPEWCRRHAPTMVVVSLVSVVCAGLAYSAFTGKMPTKGEHFVSPLGPAGVGGGFVAATSSSRG